MNAALVGFSFPVHDWQFWAVTALAAAAASWLLRGLIPVPGLAKSKSKGRRATLTVDGKPVIPTPRAGRR